MNTAKKLLVSIASRVHMTFTMRLQKYVLYAIHGKEKSLSQYLTEGTETNHQEIGQVHSFALSQIHHVLFQLPMAALSRDVLSTAQNLIQKRKIITGFALGHLHQQTFFSSLSNNGTRGYIEV